VVKEHPAMVGLRSPSFYKKLSRTPNIKLIDYHIPSDEVLKRADITLSINGTAIAEAAFLGKPAIQVGTLGTTQKLPNVTQHTDITTLSSKIKEVLAGTYEGAAYERKLENFVSAAYDTSFDAVLLRNWGTPTEDREAVWGLYRQELERVLLSSPIKM
jgi:UDP-N-acetylglucosamine 2-epimerase